MKQPEELSRQIFNIQHPKEFDALATAILYFQAEHNAVYKKYLHLLKQKPGNSVYTVPFLPVQLFKSHQVITEHAGGSTGVQTIFTSSGTTGQITSRHYVNDLRLYEASFLKAFELFYGNPADYCFLFLLPSYLEREGSSLVYMAQELVKRSAHNGSGFFLHNLDELKTQLEERKNSSQKTFLFGVSYALLDLAEKNSELNEQFIVMETGGMKGKRKEMLKEEFHTILKNKFRVQNIHSEYGMTELLSQAYSKGNGIFKCPPWMKVLIRDPYDSAALLKPGKTGCINVIDLANIRSCSFIATQDVGRVFEDGSFEVLGRLDNSELRGCNLMVE